MASGSIPNCWHFSIFEAKTLYNSNKSLISIELFSLVSIFLDISIFEIKSLVRTIGFVSCPYLVIKDCARAENTETFGENLTGGVGINELGGGIFTIKSVRKEGVKSAKVIVTTPFFPCA